MAQESLLLSTLFFGGFLGITALLQTFVRRINFPYTVALLVLGYSIQTILHGAGIEPHFNLSTDVIYFVLLPLLLFESAFHINFHQFKLQFKTITFLATFGLLVSVFSVGLGLAWLLGLPLMVALLFRALISATDPIAVLSLFKTLGAPKRLSLLAEGESMFNDATAVIAFRVLSGFVLGTGALHAQSLIASGLHFVYVFVGSLVLGGVLGLITAQFIARVNNDRVVETTLTMALALVAFIGAEHYFGLSGVIATVAAGITMGNLGRTKISGGVVQFMEEFWEYVGFLCVSLVFFFAAFNLNLSLFLADSYQTLLAILVILVARSVSIYLSFFISNHLPGFYNEPNVPLSWQHVLNWGGLRGVIPLVLVYSLPTDFAYYDIFLRLTLASFLASLLLNGLSIEWLLRKLGLHLPKKEEEIVHTEQKIFAFESARQRLDQLSNDEFDRSVILEVKRSLEREENEYRQHLLRLAAPKELELSLQLQSIEIERQTIERLFLANHISESVYAEFNGELDLQQDALEHPEVSSGRAFRSGGRLDSQSQFKHRLSDIKNLTRRFPLLDSIFAPTKKDIIFERFALLQARIVASTDVITYLHNVERILGNTPMTNAVISEEMSRQEQMRLKNHFQIQSLSRDYPRLFQEFETKMVESLAWQ